jgi:D-beta-D-heptose 7-phosphate kinase/D-beta-D-heptose 1-phosphate adenosyltransferase
LATDECSPQIAEVDTLVYAQRRSAVNESLIRSIGPVPILVAGDVMVDEYVVGEVERISPESPVPVLVVKDRLRRLGGAGNVAGNIVSLGGTVALFATVGADSAGRWFRQHCEEMAIEGFWLKEDGRRPTTIKTRVVARNQQIVRIDEEQVYDIAPDLEMKLIEELKAVVPQVKAVVISDYGKGLLTHGLVKALIREARAQRLPVLVDPKGIDFTRYRDATYITPNRSEASQASGIPIKDEESLVQAGRILLDQTHAEGIIITRGKEGSTLVSRQTTRHFPVKPVEIIDVTGAGDTVIAAIAMCVGNGLSIENALVTANFAASLVVSRFGAASVTLQEMVDALNDKEADTKVVPLGDISRILKNHRMHGKKIVFTNGCFDLLHVGHLKILREASRMGDVLVVGVNSDTSVKRIKGPDRPVMPEGERVDLVAGLSFVNYVVVFEEDTPRALIKEVRPDVLVKGDDWRGKPVVGEEIVKARGGTVSFVKLVDGVSTTDLINRIRGKS